MNSAENILFTPFKLGPITLRNRTIRAAVEKSGLSFPHQLLLNKEAVPDLRKLTDAINKEGAACSVQIGHCGNMTNSSVPGIRLRCYRSSCRSWLPHQPVSITLYQQKKRFFWRLT